MQSPEPFGQPRDRIVRHDCFRQVYLGQVADPLFPPHPGPPETPMDELTRVALEDPAAHCLNIPNDEPTVWRVVFLILFAVLALGTVFVMR
nr:hypothetical protein [uncultured Holophaga sp.]